MTEEQLQNERTELIDAWGFFTSERLQKKAPKDHGDLEYSILYELGGASATEDVTHSFNYYGKFSDMGVGRGQKIEDVKSNGDLIARTRRPNKWFSKTYFPQISELSRLLSEKYGEQATNVIQEGFSGL